MAPSKMPMVKTKKTKTALVWTIYNLPLPVQIFSVKLNTKRKCIIVRDAKNKLFKKFLIPDLEHYNLPFEEENLECKQLVRTLTISYKKPQKLIDIEKQLHEQRKQMCPDIPNECKAQ